MAKRMVTCDRCHRRFDVNRGGRFDSLTGRGVCPACMAGRVRVTGGTIAKIAFGLFIIIACGAPDESWEFSTFLLGLVLGGALIAWGLLPYLRSRAALRQMEADAAAEEQARRERMEIVRNVPRVCSACGATTRGTICEYCGTRLK
jgi:hypothetical protein